MSGTNIKTRSLPVKFAPFRYRRTQPRLSFLFILPFFDAEDASQMAIPRKFSSSFVVFKL